MIQSWVKAMKCALVAAAVALGGCSKAGTSPSVPKNPTATTTKPVVVLTEGAAREVKRIMSEQGLPSNTVLRVSVKQGGSTGFMYDMKYEATVDAERDYRSESHGVVVLVDKSSAPFIEGTSIDFEDKPGARGFRFHNPNAREQ
jgi:iron-sulfur cluster assembly protein